MKYISTVAVLASLFVWCLFLPGTIHAADRSWEQITEYGYIDWLNQKVYATGVGLLPQDKQSQTQAKTLAHRAAIVVAQRNLLEVIKGVHIDSQTRLENRFVRDDRIISKVEGIVRFSQVEDSQVIDDGAVRVTVSMPLSGKMGEVIVHAIEGSGVKPHGSIPSGNVTDRLQHLERRVTVLENKLSRLNQISAEQQSLIQLFAYLVETRHHHDQFRSGLLPVDLTSGQQTGALQHQLDQQEKQMAAMYVRLNELSRRLEKLEDNTQAQSLPSTGQPSTPIHPYTGLIVDARDTGFRPSLRPGLYHQGELIYPGSNLNLPDAIRGGYVRYYTDRFQAQQSDRIGSLPYATKATGIHKGNRSLAIDADAANLLKAIQSQPQNFLSQCRVVIIF
jgi:uncharacterized coiled-coil protein SlyX